MATERRARELTSVVVVAADSGPLLGACIESVLATAAPIEILLVDNASADGQVDAVAAAHAQEPRLRVLRNANNRGFGPACNQAAAVAHGDVLVFLNPDCRVQPDTIAHLRAALADAHDGLIGATIRSPSGELGRGVRRRDPLFTRLLASMTGFSRWESRWPSLQGIEIGAPPPATGLERVDAVSGACMALTARVFDELDGFDEGYFLHFEDLDLCRRTRDAGYGVFVAGDISIVHAQGSSSRHRRVFVAYHKHRGMWRYFRKFDPAYRSTPLRAALWVAIWLHFAAMAPVYFVRSRITALRTDPA